MYKMFLFLKPALSRINIIAPTFYGLVVVCAFFSISFNQSESFYLKIFVHNIKLGTFKNILKMFLTSLFINGLFRPFIFKVVTAV
jgi:hypothetical protein